MGNEATDVRRGQGGQQWCRQSEATCSVISPPTAQCAISAWTLDEGLDDEGKPLVCDCSCRGDSAGIAHLSCISKYAKQKSRAVTDCVFDTGETCPNWLLDLSSAFVSFAEETYNHIGNSIKDRLIVLCAH